MSDVKDFPIVEWDAHALPLQPSKYSTDSVSELNGLQCFDESLAVQADKEDADINTIVRRFGLTGQLPSNLKPPAIEDFTEVFDFQSAMNAVRQGQETFAELPADVRYRFGNDPQRFLQFCTELTPDGQKLANLEEMRKMGLAVPEVKADAPATPPPA